MNGPSKSREFTLRQATEQDIRQLSIHHRKMFEEIWEKKGQQIGSSASIEIEQTYYRKLSKELPAGSCRSWLIKKGNHIVASGAITIVSLVPTPNDFSSKVAYLHSIYTERAFRGKSFANRIVREALEYCRANGIKRVFLNASDAGRPIYERIGFSSSSDMMRIFVE